MLRRRKEPFQGIGRLREERSGPARRPWRRRRGMQEETGLDDHRSPAQSGLLRDGRHPLQLASFYLSGASVRGRASGVRRRRVGVDPAGGTSRPAAARRRPARPVVHTGLTRKSPTLSGSSTTKTTTWPSLTRARWLSFVYEQGYYFLPLVRVRPQCAPRGDLTGFNSKRRTRRRSASKRAVSHLWPAAPGLCRCAQRLSRGSLARRLDRASGSPGQLDGRAAGRAGGGALRQAGGRWTGGSSLLSAGRDSASDGGGPPGWLGSAMSSRVCARKAPGI